MMENKPPLGVLPKKIWLEDRLRALIGAFGGYVEVKKDVPYKWVEEFLDISNQINENFKGDK